MEILIIFVSLILVSAGEYAHHKKIMKNLRHLKSKTPILEQHTAALELIERIVPKYSDRFVIVITKEYFENDDNDAFQIQSIGDGKIMISATSGVAAAAGFYHYIKYWCKGHISWSGSQLNLPDTLPEIKKPVTKYFREKFRYYQNVCTVSYSMAFWDWERWEKEIDWMALNGINLPLAFTGQESIWRMVYKKLGLTQKELDEHFAGPAFLAWQRMGNLEGWGGPLPDSWYRQQLLIQQNILKRMRSLGMIPVLPGFAGHIPKPLTDRIYVNSTFYKLGPWVGFGPGTYLLDGQDQLYQKIGYTFIKTQIELYNGTDHIYNADVFNEMEPPESSPKYIFDTSKAIFQSMLDADSEAVWLMQGWMFLSDYWKDDLMKAWFQAVPLGRLIILDLASDIYPIYKSTSGYFGYPYIWNMIENFGGTTRLYGKNYYNMKNLLSSRSDNQLNSSLIGIGMTPEGIEQNDINFEVMNELGWRKEPFNLTYWSFEYIERRYGFTNKEFKYAYTILMSSLYNSSLDVQNGGYSGAGRVPVMKPKITSKLNPTFWYKPSDLMKAWQYMIDGCEESNVKLTDTLIYDVAQLGTQVLEDTSIIFYEKLINAYYNKSLNDAEKFGTMLIDLLNDMDELLSTDRYSLLGNWIESAKHLGTNEKEKRLLEYNARNQITLWGPDGQISDYANKNWAGLVKTYYVNRWTIFVDEIVYALKYGHKFNQSDFKSRLFKFETGWNNDTTVYTTKPNGDVIKISKALISKYNSLLENHRYPLSSPKQKKVKGHMSISHRFRFAKSKHQRINNKMKNIQLVVQ